jgi:transcriptional regulator with XRE-family HTH domain
MSITKNSVIARRMLPEIGRRVRLTRFERGLSLQALADVSGCSPQLLSYLERAERNVSLLASVRVCDALGISLDDLVAGLPEVRDEMLRTLWARSADGDQA